MDVTLAQIVEAGRAELARRKEDSGELAGLLRVERRRQDRESWAMLSRLVRLHLSPWDDYFDLDPARITWHPDRDRAQSFDVSAWPFWPEPRSGPAPALGRVYVEFFRDRSDVWTPDAGPRGLARDPGPYGPARLFRVPLCVAGPYGPVPCAHCEEFLTESFPEAAAAAQEQLTLRAHMAAARSLDLAG